MNEHCLNGIEQPSFLNCSHVCNGSDCHGIQWACRREISEVYIRNKIMHNGNTHITQPPTHILSFCLWNYSYHYYCYYCCCCCHCYCTRADNILITYFIYNEIYFRFTWQLSKQPKKTKQTENQSKTMCVCVCLHWGINGLRCIRIAIQRKLSPIAIKFTATFRTQFIQFRSKFMANFVINENIMFPGYLRLPAIHV